MQELKLHFQTDPEEEIDNSTKQYVADTKNEIDNSIKQYDDIENSEYDSISIPKPKPYNDDEYDY